MKKILPIFCLALLSLVPSYPQQEFRLVISEGMPVIPVALPAFITRDNSEEAKAAAELLREVVGADLRYSRIFSLLPEKYYGFIRPLNPDKIFFKDWESISATMLITGEVSRNAEGEVIFEGKVYDVKSERFIRGKSYQAERAMWRTAAHRFSNLLMEIYGEPPIFTSKVAFVSNRDGNDELYMMDYDGHNQTRLTFNKIKDYMPAWSADGRTLAYTAYQGETAGLYLLNIYEQTRTPVFDKGTCAAASFSPDGRWLAFASTQDRSNTDIYLARADGTGVRRLTFSPSVETAPTWSPTGREIAFTSDRGGTPQIYIMDAEGSNIRRRSFGGNYHDGPAWSPTGDRICYVSRVESVFDLYVLDLRSDQIIKLTEGYARNEYPAWSPDGRHIIFQSNRITGEVQLFSIDYDGANLKRLTSSGENKLADWSRQ
jgi:TolB protein